jgi:leader peptidase (prepilin peptidase)/N-methyltransferase
MMIESEYGRLIFLLFLSVCVFQDIREKSIDLRVFLLMSAAEILWYIRSTVTGTQPDFVSLLLGAGTGAALYVLSFLSRGAVGTGDALFFLLAGGASGLQSVLLLLSASLFLAGLFSLVFLVAGFVRKKSMRKFRIPFLPFTALPAFFIYFSGMVLKGGAG